MIIWIYLALCVLIALLFFSEKATRQRAESAMRGMINNLQFEVERLREKRGAERHVQKMPAYAFRIVCICPGALDLVVADRPGDFNRYLVRGLIDPAPGKFFLGGDPRTYSTAGDLPSRQIAEDEVEENDTMVEEDGTLADQSEPM